MAIENSDLFVLQRPGTKTLYKLSVSDLPGSTVPTVQDAPADAKAGDLYWDIAEATLYIYYENYWVPATPTPSIPSEIDGGVY